jgi:ComF family protein
LPFCPACGPPAPAASSALEGVPLLVAGAYAPPLAQAICRLKFEGRAELARELAALLAPRLALFGLGPGTAFVPVPLHRERLVERGFNQSALVASALAASTGGRFVPRALERSRKTAQQARLGRGEREANVRQAFVARAGLVPSRSVLVDDVVTTGATALACVRALRQAGSEVLAIAALARADGAR